MTARFLPRMAAILVCGIVGTASVASGQTLRASTVAAGSATTSTAGSLALRATVGQPAARLSGDSAIRLGSGFWNVVRIAAPSPTVTPTATASVTASVTATNTATVTPTNTATATPTAPLSTTPTASPTPSASPTAPPPTSTPTESASPTPTSTATETPTPTATATATTTITPTVIGCPGDCSGDGDVTVDEIVRLVNIALGRLAIDACASGDSNGDDLVTVDEILLAVNAGLAGCQPAAS